MIYTWNWKKKAFVLVHDHMHKHPIINALTVTEAHSWKTKGVICCTTSEKEEEQSPVSFHYFISFCVGMWVGFIGPMACCEDWHPFILWLFSLGGDYHLFYKVYLYLYSCSWCCPRAFCLCCHCGSKALLNILYYFFCDSQSASAPAYGDRASLGWFEFGFSVL